MAFFKRTSKIKPAAPPPQPKRYVMQDMIVPTPAKVPTVTAPPLKQQRQVDENRRTFLKAAGGVGLGIAAATLLPSSANALVMGGTPSTSVVGLKNASNTRVNPATDETLQEILTGQGVSKKTVFLSASGTVHTPTSGKRVRVYANRFSLSADATSVSFRFTSGGTDFEKYSTPKAGGLYGANNHPNYIEGGTDEALYCVISGTTTVQINVDYLEITP